MVATVAQNLRGELSAATTAELAREPAAIRVLVVDDSLIVRTVLGRILSLEADIEVVGCASNGAQALERASDLRPDVVILDVDMPGMSGLEVLEALRALDSPPVVVMFSGLTRRASVTSLTALGLGAAECVEKPDGCPTVESMADTVREKLVGKIRLLACRARMTRETRALDSRLTTPRPPSPIAPPSPRAPVSVIAIASSTGGPQALRVVLSSLPADVSVPILIVQHMPAAFTPRLAAQLDACCALSVREATAGEVLRPGAVWLAPGAFHLSVARAGGAVVTALDEEAAENSVRPAADVLFRSLAAAYGGGVLAVVLTGMGQDGFLGAQRIVAAGGLVLTQDRHSCAVWGMPRRIEEAGLSDAVLPLDAIAGELRRRLRVCGREPERVAP